MKKMKRAELSEAVCGRAPPVPGNKLTVQEGGVVEEEDGEVGLLPDRQLVRCLSVAVWGMCAAAKCAARKAQARCNRRRCASSAP